MLSLSRHSILKELSVVVCALVVLPSPAWTQRPIGASDEITFLLFAIAPLTRWIPVPGFDPLTQCSADTSPSAIRR